jgi:hypothetical protein
MAMIAIAGPIMPPCNRGRPGDLDKEGLVQSSSRWLELEQVRP